MERAFYLTNIFFVIQICAPINSAFEGCGYPGLSNGVKILNPTLNWEVNVHHRIGDVIEYECINKEIYRLHGNRQRICQNNGTWNGIIPWCVENISFSENATVYLHNGSSIYLENFTKQADNNKCHLLEPGPKARIAIIFKNEHFFEQVNIFGSKDYRDIIKGDQLVVKYQDKEVGQCQRISNIYDLSDVQYYCNSAISKGNTLQFWHSSSKPIQICGIEVFAKKDKLECSYPEKPIHSYVILIKELNSHSALYQCDDEFELVGSQRRDCIDTLWSGEQPVCRKMDPEKMKAIEMERMALLKERKEASSWTGAIIALTVLFIVAIVIIITRRYWWDKLATQFRKLFKLSQSTNDVAHEDSEPSRALFSDDQPD